jgi:predicted negative regulator of RcsB-dependent stress response
LTVRPGKIAAAERRIRREDLVEEYLSERQQIEAVRGWVRENAPWAVAGVLIGVAALVGWQQYQAWQERTAQGGAEKYAATVAALGRNDADAAGKLAKELHDHYARTPYGDMASLAIARYDVETGKLAEAATLLGQVLGDTRDPDLKVVVRLRLARVLHAEGKPEEALATLAAGPADSPAYADVRGDVLGGKGDAAGALTAWRAALAAKDLDAAARQLIELKFAAAGGDEAAPPPAATGVKP